jgi:hypothetical protein
MKIILSLATFSAVMVVPLLIESDEPKYPKAVQKALYTDDIPGKPALKLRSNPDWFPLGHASRLAAKLR